MIREILDRNEWNEFILGLDANTFLQSWEWGQVQLATGETVKYLGIFEGSEQIGAALVIVVNARRGRHYLIPHGPLAADEIRVRWIVPELVAWLKKQSQQDRICCLRVAPLMLANEENEKFWQGLGFGPAPLHVHAELTWVLDISRTEVELKAGMRKTTRHAVRKAEQAGVMTKVVVDPIEALQRFWPLYEQTKQRHGFVVWPKMMVEAQLKNFSAGNHIFTVIAQYNGQDVAAAILPYFGQTVFYYHGASIKLPSSVPAAQLLQWAAIKEAKKRGATRYNFWGIAPEAKPNHPFAGLTVFKKGFGGQEISYMHAQDLPLSWKYLSLWLVDSYRRIKRGF